MQINYSLRKTITLILFLFSFSGFSQVNFSFTPTNGCVPLPVTYTYTGNTSGNFFRWYFGDGDSSHAKNPAHTFLTPGWYNVMLSVWDTTGGGKTYLGQMNSNIQVDGATDFNIFSSTACPNENISFSFNQGNYSSISWNFGDLSPQQNYNYTQHSYAASGTYTVSMTINTSCGNKTISKQVVISNTAKPNFTISSNQQSVCINDAVNFSTQYQAAAYMWAFGDGAISTLSSPSHAYTTPGTKQVILTATNSCGGSNKDTLYVNVVSTGLSANANFSFGPNPVCTNSIVNISSGSSGTFAWDLGDGTTSTKSSVKNFYTTAGTYTVRLIVTNGCGDKDTVIQNLTVGGTTTMSNVFIRFNNSNWNKDTLEVCPGSLVEINNQNSWNDGKYSFLWKFGDGTTATTKNAMHLYTVPGTHKVRLIVTNACGKSDSATKTVIVNPNLAPKSMLQFLPDSLCPGAKAYFFDESDNNGGNIYSINFGDGSSMNNITGSTDTVVGVLAAHTYSTSGTYNFKFYVTNLCGKKDSLKKSIVVLASGPKKHFYYVDNSTINNGGNEDRSACPGDPVKFVAVGGAAYSWLFGDGQSAQGQSVVHSYATAGTYTAKLIGTNHCGQTDTIPTIVEVKTTNKPQAWFEIDKTFTCSGDTIHFKAQSNNNDGPSSTTYMWDFGDGSTSALLNAAHVYAAKGVYDVKLTATNGCGSNSQSTTIIIDKPAVMLTGITSAYCSYNSAVTLTGTPSGGTFKIDGVAATTFDPAILSPGVHTVLYNYTNSNGCSSTDTKTVVVNKTIANAGADVSVCAAGNAQLNASGGTTYSWSPATNLSDPNIASPVASPLTTTIYTVSVTKNGCIATDEVQVSVAAVLTSNAGTNTSVCSGKGVTLNGSGGGNYSWSPSGSLSSSTIPNPVASPNTTTVYTLTVSSGSCTNTSTVTVTVDPTVTMGPTSVNASCNGTSTGSANANASGGTGTLTYAWSNGATTSSITGLSAATYTVTATDTKGCNSIGTVSVGQPTPLTAVANSSANVSCNGGSNGSATVVASGGTGNFTYSWSNSSTSQTISGLMAASYTVAVKDGNNCITLSTVSITQPVILSVTSASQDVSCQGCSDGTAAVFANGGTQPYTYTWNPGGQTSLSISGLPSGTYSACATDSKGCTSCTTVNIGQPLGMTTNGNDAGIINVYPNPTNGTFQLSITDLNSSAEFVVMDVTGKKVYSRSVPNTKTFSETINLSIHSCGVYYARLTTSTGSVSVRRIVISK